MNDQNYTGLGDRIIRLLGLKVLKSGKVSTEYGTKTPFGLGRMIYQIVNDICQDQVHAAGADQLALEAFTQRHGRNWRARLRDQWTSSQDFGWQRRLRNSVGSEGLDKLKVNIVYKQEKRT